ncbi:MAG: VWA domain-containing protein [Syntrophobacteraceae bacterium]|nr:VWA domain-containing protein [Syntrophobacteraceae bacterium]
MHNAIGGQKGSILVIFALTLVVLIGFTALGIEAGQWYLTQAELSKAVDAASLAGVANLSSPKLNSIVQDIGAQNFQSGYLGTPTSGTGAVSFTVARPSGNEVSVTGQTNASALLAGVLGINNVAVKSQGTASVNHFQIMLVLDNSGSMAGTPISDLTKAARTFIGYFENTDMQAQNQMGLVTFATAPKVVCPLAPNYYTPILNATYSMTARGATNSEDALDQAGQQLPDQSETDSADRIPQFIIFFTDGHPTAFTSTFTTNGAPSTEVCLSSGNCDSDFDTPCGLLSYSSAQDNSSNPSCTEVTSPPTGDGLPVSKTVCVAGRNKTGYANTRWGAFASYPLPGLGRESYPAYCKAQGSLFAGQSGYICRTAHQMTLDIATALKSRSVQVYAIGLGNEIDTTFLGELASGSDYLFIAPDSSKLQSIFSTIAQDIQLRLVK